MAIYNKKTLKTGYYTVVNKEKLKNKNKRLCYRSGLELKFMRICDHSKNIIEWSYEDFIIPYVKIQEQNKIHRYIIDFYVKKIINGKIEDILIEVKPSSMLIPPEEPKRKTRRYYELVENYLTNMSKWKQAAEYCKSNNMLFKIVTEQHLN